MHPRLGFSTGAFYQYLTTAEALAALRQANCRVVEIGLVRQQRIVDGWLDAVTSSDLADFGYVSLHAPADQEYRDDEPTHQLISKLNAFHSRRPLDAVVIHPDKIIDWSILTACQFPVAFENMDCRKASFRTIAKVRELLERYPESRFVFDINHAYTNHFDLAATVREVKTIEDRLAHIHLSGYTEYHEPLSITRQHELIEAILPLTVSIIVESVLSPEMLASEATYISQYLPAS